MRKAFSNLTQEMEADARGQVDFDVATDRVHFMHDGHDISSAREVPQTTGCAQCGRERQR